MASKAKSSDRPDLRLAWHFLPEDGKLAYGDGRKVEVGKTYSADSAGRSIQPCYYGMHASERISDAAGYTRGPILTRVEVWGEVRDNGDKIAGRHRKVLWMHKLTKHEILSCCAYVGHKPDSKANIGDLVAALGEAAAHDEDKFNLWMEAYAAQLGAPISPKKKLKIQLSYVKPDLTATILKGLLSDRLVRTQVELYETVKDLFDEDTIDDAFDNLGYEEGVCVVDGYDRSTGSDGYVLQVRSKKRK